MPKCKRCGLDVARDKYGNWQHVAAGMFSHSADPVDLSGPKAVVRPAPPRSTAPSAKAAPKAKAPVKVKFRVTKYLEKRNAKKRGRLPDGAVFNVRYDAKAKEWSGILSVPGTRAVSGKHSGVFRLLETLDGLYRQAVACADSPHKGDRKAGDYTAPARGVSPNAGGHDLRK